MLNAVKRLEMGIKISLKFADYFKLWIVNSKSDKFYKNCNLN
jgi:hypothetical protein